jgi:protein SCO1/2
MRMLSVWLVLALLAAACGGSSDRREFTLQGQIISVAADRRQATIKHEEIPGFMAAMTMPYEVQDPKEYESLAPGDLITARLVVLPNAGYLEAVRKVGEAPLERAAGDVGAGASGGFELIKTGAPVPNVTLVDQEGKTVTLDTFRGSAIVVTFIYTSCPMPDFCPLMDRNFAAIQKKLQEQNNELKVHLLSVSFDPAIDTPAVMKKHAAALGADPRLWSFVTGDRDEVDKWAAGFGMAISRAMNDPRDITHNLRTVILDRQGNLVQTYGGNEWTPEQVVADVRVMVGVD